MKIVVLLLNFEISFSEHYIDLKVSDFILLIVEKDFNKLSSAFQNTSQYFQVHVGRFSL